MKHVFTILAICFLGLTKSYGCGCDTISFKAATEWADEIFFGRIIRIREVQSYTEWDGKPDTRIWAALFEVEKKWKGSHSKYVEVFQPHTSCDFSFEFPSQPYIVYAKEGELIVWDSTQSFYALGTWLCARNADYATYNLYTENGFDDRFKLDGKYPVPIKLAGFNMDWKLIIIGLVIFLIGILLGRIIKKRGDRYGHKT